MKTTILFTAIATTTTLTTIPTRSHAIQSMQKIFPTSLHAIIEEVHNYILARWSHLINKEPTSSPDQGGHSDKEPDETLNDLSKRLDELSKTQNITKEEVEILNKLRNELERHSKLMDEFAKKANLHTNAIKTNLPRISQEIDKTKDLVDKLKRQVDQIKKIQPNQQNTNIINIYTDNSRNETEPTRPTTPPPPVPPPPLPRIHHPRASISLGLLHARTSSLSKNIASGTYTNAQFHLTETAGISIGIQSAPIQTHNTNSMPGGSVLLWDNRILHAGGTWNPLPSTTLLSLQFEGGVGLSTSVLARYTAGAVYIGPAPEDEIGRKLNAVLLAKGTFGIRVLSSQFGSSTIHTEPHVSIGCMFFLSDISHDVASTRNSIGSSLWSATLGLRFTWSSSRENDTARDGHQM